MGVRRILGLRKQTTQNAPPGLFLLSVALLLPASGHAQESCRAIAPVPSFWTYDDLTERNIRLTVDGRYRAWHYRDGDGVGVEVSVRWVDSTQSWQSVQSYRTEVALTPAWGEIASITWMPLDSETLTFVPYQRDVRTYNAGGHLLTDTRQDYVGGTWYDNRRALIERDSDGVMTAQRFERIRDGAWTTDFEMRTEFDEAGNRTLCEHASLVEGTDSLRVYLQYISAYDAEGRMVHQVRNQWNWRVNTFEADSVALSYENGQYTSYTSHRRSSETGPWSASHRYAAQYDVQGRVASLVLQQATSNAEGAVTWDDARQYLWTFRPDGLIETETRQRWDAGTETWSTDRRETYVTAMDIPPAPEPIPPPEAVRLGAMPNPFASEATLTLDVPEAAPVRVEVFDARGRRVAVAFDGELDAGTETLPLRLGGVPAGVYLVRATVGAEAVTEAVTVIR